MKRWKYLQLFAIFAGLTILTPTCNFAVSQLTSSSLQISILSENVDSNVNAKYVALPNIDLTNSSLDKYPTQATAFFITRNISPILMQTGSGLILLGVGGLSIIVLAGVAVIFIKTSIVTINNNEIGIVFKKFTINPSHQKLSPGCRIALNDEAGFQADTLLPGNHFWHWPWMYTVNRVPFIEVPQEQIALVVASQGQPSLNHRRLGKVVPCDDFQDARAFLLGGGEQGQQLGVLKPGRYGINLELFKVITQANATQYGIDPDILQVYKVNPGNIGIVTTNEGRLLPTDDHKRQMIAPRIPGHHGFQNPQVFIDSGGYKGIQEEVLSEGEWTLNPWFVDVEQVPITKIHAGTVGVVIAQDGQKTSHQIENSLVEAYSDYRGIWNTVLYQGTELLNPRFLEIELVPTNKISLEWSNENKPHENYDSKLKAIQLYSKDGFDFEIDVKQVIRILPENAPKVIAAVGVSTDSKNQNFNHTRLGIAKYPSIKNLIVKVLQPIVTNEFLNAAKDFNALDFHERRSEIQLHVTVTIREKLREQGIEAEETLINEIHLPIELQKILKDRALREERSKDIGSDIVFEQKLQSLAYAKALTDLQDQLAKSQQDVKIADLQAQADKLKGTAQADILQAMVNVLGRDGYLTQQQIEHLGDLQLPETLIMGGGNGDTVDSLQALMYPLLFQSNTPITSPLQPTVSSRTVLPSAQPPNSLSSVKPRCPIAVLLDTSETVSNYSLDQFIEGLSILRQEIMLDSTAANQVDISIVTFGDTAKLVQSFTPINRFSPPQLQANGSNVLSHGLELALNAIDEQKLNYQSQNTPFYKPWIILLTHSTTTEYKKSVSDRVAQAVDNKELLLLKVALSQATLDNLAQKMVVGLPPILLKESKFYKFFQWLANSIKSLSSREVGERFSLPPMDSWAKD